MTDFLQMRKHLLELEELERQKYYKSAWEKARAVAAMLKHKYRVDKVYVYGSLAWGWFQKQSDIDLFLIGFKGDYWKALGDAEDISSPIEISLVCTEDAFDSLQKKVLERGIEL